MGPSLASLLNMIQLQETSGLYHSITTRRRDRNFIPVMNVARSRP